MQKINIHILKSAVTTLVVIALFSCTNNFKAVQNVGILQNQPISEAYNINLKYTEYQNNDSLVKLVANLKGTEMLDFGNRPFGYTAFPKGIELIIYGDAKETTTIFADYAVSFTKTGLLDLQGNVRVITHNKDTLFTEQLYYNQKEEWVFTNKPILFKGTDGPISGSGFDSDKDFKNYQILDMGGDFKIDN